MKEKVLLSVLLTLFVSSSCEKSRDTFSKDLIGKWNWTKTVILAIPDTRTPQNTGITEIIEFKTNMNWLKVQNGVPLDSGTYSLGHGSYSAYTGATVFEYDSIVYKNSSGIISHDYYKIHNDTLHFSSYYAGYIGGGSKFYKKL